MQIMKKVDFISMDEGTKEDYDLIAIHDSENERGLSKRVIEWLKMMDGESPYQISRLQHSLQTATRAENDGADIETIVCALLHGLLLLQERTVSLCSIAEMFLAFVWAKLRDLVDYENVVFDLVLRPRTCQRSESATPSVNTRQAIKKH